MSTVADEDLKLIEHLDFDTPDTCSVKGCQSKAWALIANTCCGHSGFACEAHGRIVIEQFYARRRRAACIACKLRAIFFDLRVVPLGGGS